MSELLTVEQVAEILRVSTDTVVRRFAKEEGVVDLGTPESPKRRRYRVLRIPKSVVERFLARRGGRVRVETPVPKAKKRGDWEGRLVQELAAAVSHDGEEARKTLDRIAKRAKTLTFVPKELWSDVVWFDEEEE